MKGERNKPDTNPEARRLQKPVEKTGFPPLEPKPAIEDLRFIARESIKLAGRLLTELDKVLSVLRK